MSLRADVALELGPLELDVSLAASPGEVVALLGPNGAGKTTLLRTIAGLVPLRGGRIELENRVLDDPALGIRLPVEARRVGIVFQDYLLFPHLSALENVAFGLRAGGVPRAEARRRAAAWLERVGLSGRAAARPGELSGGQAQRVALARTLAVEPRLLALDEPLAALDVEARQEIRAELRAHLVGFTGPVLLVTHDPLDAVTLADRLVILEGGRVTQAGTIDEVTRRPRSTWVARLVGVNLWEGTAGGGSIGIGRVQLVAAGGPASGHVLVAVRPQAVSLYRRRPEGSPRNTWPGAVDGLEALGDRIRVHLAGALPVVAEVTPGAVSDLRLADGGRVWASVKATEVDVYPA